MDKNYFNRKVLSLRVLPLAAVAFVATSVFSSCDKDSAETPSDMECFYNESRGLMQVEGDSIKRFATKFDNYVTTYPESKNDPYYPVIKDNINEAAKNCGIVIIIDLNPAWDGDDDISF